MKTLLRIDASTRIKGSHTRTLTDYFQTQWLSHYPEHKIIHRCLASDPIPHLTHETINAFHQTEEPSSDSTLSDTLIDELKRADHLLIGSPLYNLTLPSTLKAYFDHVVRAGLTFEVRQDNSRGLLNGKSATLITARGSKPSPTVMDDFQTTYLTNILAFIGIDAVEVVALEGMALDQQTKEKAISYAKQQIDGLINRTDSPVWQGEFSEYDKQQINFLRAAQADAIAKGDASAYAELCTNNIQLLIPSQDVITGRNALLDVEQALFKRAKFARFQKVPLHIERSGNLAVEVGRQEVTMQNQHNTGGVFSTWQKYTHVFRLTPQGWRFAILMSNPNG
ncbi:MAG: NAD(P)H-dependent oxidoreductase [Cyanobacteria bacterium P01_F01_bin.150]